MSDKSQIRLPDGSTYVGKVIAGEVRLKGKKGDWRMVLMFEIDGNYSHQGDRE